MFSTSQEVEREIERVRAAGDTANVISNYLIPIYRDLLVTESKQNQEEKFYEKTFYVVLVERNRVLRHHITGRVLLFTEATEAKLYCQKQEQEDPTSIKVLPSETIRGLVADGKKFSLVESGRLKEV